MKRLTDQTGQALVLSALFLTVLLGMAAVSVDVGSWYHADRQAQAAADASALAAAQELPYDSVTSESHAKEYATKNGGGLKSVAFSGPGTGGDDTVTVEIEREAPGFFSQVLGVSAVTVNAKAAARAAPLGKARWVAPIVVSEKHPKLVCGLACFGPAHDTTLNYQHLKDVGTTDGSGSFGFLNLDVTATTGVGTSTLGEWIQHGFDGLLEPDTYNTSTGNPFSSSHVNDSLQNRLGTELLFPIYRKITGSGSNAKYEIVGFVGFYLTGIDVHGSNEKLFGYFTQVVWDGVESETGPPVDYGARVVTLVE
jgi:Putative Flp pilus-assembly TadE/G-like